MSLAGTTSGSRFSRPTTRRQRCGPSGSSSEGAGGGPLHSRTGGEGPHPPGEGYFALASAPSPDGRADLLMKRGGRIADAAIEAGQAGGSLELSHPFGKGFPVREAEGKDVLLFAAGSAIAPIRALIQHLLAHRVLFNRLTLFYGQRRGADFAFRRSTPTGSAAGCGWCSVPRRRPTPGRGFAQGPGGRAGAGLRRRPAGRDGGLRVRDGAHGGRRPRHPGRGRGPSRAGARELLRRRRWRPPDNRES